MTWFWSSSSPSPKPEGSSDGRAPPPASTAPAPAPPAATPPTQTPPAEPVDREVAMFMDMLMKDAQSSSSRPSQQQQQQQQQPQQPPPPPPTTASSSLISWLPWSSKSQTPEQQQQPLSPATFPPQQRPPHSYAMSEHLLPTTQSCRDAFDYAWHCHTPGSQWNAVYRYGAARPCTELWDDFWFCMRTKSYSPEMRAEAVREHYRAKEEAKYGGGRPSSEDVWESREERVAPGTAFRAPFSPPVADDAEFQRADAERRRKVREEMEKGGK